VLGAALCPAGLLASGLLSVGLLCADLLGAVVPGDAQLVALQVDRHVFRADPRQVGLDPELLVALLDIDPGAPRSSR
jgi:hypothetical protein